MLFDSSVPSSALATTTETDSRENESGENATCLELEALILRGRAGERDAQSELVRRYRHRVAGFVRKLVRQRSTIEDIVQTTMIRMVHRLPYLRSPQFFESWVFRIARNEVLDTLRRARCRPVTLGDDDRWPEVADHHNALSRFELEEAAAHAMEGLPAMEREIIALVIAGHSYDAIAERTRLTLATVKIRVYRLRLVLRPRMLAALGGAVPRFSGE